ncbi:phytoene desaturase family protein [Isobaculum melis]|uniref:Phytoene dehydrogenase-related protein n=1 Tax=Isobaculum melis TaxID=142588 RepID=A0A1H9SRD9_9LACT|nr:FAD-dependent oxidoreductase [Isobaculum melis]SER86963.1 Phytoene dehydrogenase-related protein [Isobaculum melis]
MKKKIIIIGGGISGLSAGIYAQKNGFETTIYEKHTMLGGHCTYWDRRGYTIDGSISYLTGVKPNEDLYQVWQELKAFKDEEIHYQDVFATVENETAQLHWYRDLDKLEQHLIEVAPEDTLHIQTLIHDIKLMQHIKIPAKKSMESMHLLDWMKQIKQMGPALKISNKYRKMTVIELANQFKNELIRQIITAFVPSGFQAMAFMTTAANFATNYSAKIYGGAKTLVNNLIKEYENVGGTAYCDQGIKKILVENQQAIGVELENGEHIHADFVIAACDPALTFQHFLPMQYTNKDYAQLISNPEVGKTHSMIQLFFGVDLDLSKYPSFYIKKGETYLDANQQETDFFAFEHFCEDDDFTATTGKSILKIGIPTKDYALWKNLDRRSYYQKKKELQQMYRQKLIEVLPEIEGKIEMVDMSTPVTIERYCSSFEGAYMGVELTPALKKQYLSNSIKHLNNVVLASQWTMLSGGLPTAALSGKFAIQKICKKEGLTFKGVS